MYESNKRILIIANPVAQSGRAADAAVKAERFIRSKVPASLDLMLSESAAHATAVAAASASYDLVIALGGDGIVHDVASGLMKVDSRCRPVFGVIPYGSGNDFARSLGMSFKFEEALEQILIARPVTIDVGQVNEHFFFETLSFGLDAGIALDTVERRKKSGKKGLRLYMESGFDQIFNHFTQYAYTAQFITPDGPLELKGDSYIFAIQNGPTYGGGFLICPEADMGDGFFDVCVVRPPLNRLTGTALFLRAKNAGHVNHKNVSFYKASSIEISWGSQPPAQMDGEPIESGPYTISILPDALQVLMP